MKWKNKGREFDECASLISENFKRNIESMKLFL